jgi:hypothetical protein
LLDPLQSIDCALPDPGASDERIPVAPPFGADVAREAGSARDGSDRAFAASKAIGFEAAQIDELQKQAAASHARFKKIKPFWK